MKNASVATSVIAKNEPSIGPSAEDEQNDAEEGGAGGREDVQTEKLEELLEQVVDYQDYDQHGRRSH